MNGTQKTTRNGFVDIQKFFYAWIIVIFHFYEHTHEHLMGGGTAVEFFLIVSGAFFFASYKRKTEGLGKEERLNYPITYIKKRILRFLPYTLPAFIIAFLIRVVLTSDGRGINSVPYMIDTFVRNIWELPLISMCGLNGGKGMLNGVTWTISAMVIVEFAVLNFLVRNEKTFCTFLAPLAILVGCGFWAQVEDQGHLIWHGFTTFGVIRTFIMTCLGIYVWMGSKWLAEKNITPKGKVTLAVIEVFLHIVVVLSMMYRSTRYYRMFLALLFAIAITITISQQSYIAKWFKQNRVTNFLGEWSMSIYVIHYLIHILLYKYFDSPYIFYKFKYVYGLMVIFFSLVLLYLARWINHKGPIIYKKVRSFFLEYEIDPKTEK